MTKNETDLEEVDVVVGSIENITEEEVGRALKEMKNRKAPGPSGVSINMLKRAGKGVEKHIPQNPHSKKLH